MKNDLTAETAPKAPFTIMFETDTLDRGGLENVVYDLVTGLDPVLFQSVVVCVNGGGHVADMLEKKGAIVEILGQDKEKAFLMLLDRYNPDLLLSHHSFLGKPLAHRFGTLIASVLHNMYLWFDADVLSIVREQDPFVERYIAVSATVKDFSVERFRIPREKVTVIPNGIDLAQLNAYAASKGGTARADWDLKDDDILFLNVAAVTQVKNQNLIVESVRELVKDCPHIKVFILGKTLTEKYRTFLQEKIDRYELNSHIRFIEYTDRIYDLYSLADAFLLPSFMEGWSLAAMEAHCFGLPLILSRVGGAEDLAAAGADVRFIDLYPKGTKEIHNETIFELAEKTDTDQVAALASILREVAESAKDGHEKRGLDLELAQRFSKENMIHAYEKELLRIIAESAKRRKSESGEDLRVRMEHLFREMYDQRQAIKTFEKNFIDHNELAMRGVADNRALIELQLAEHRDGQRFAMEDRADLRNHLIGIGGRVTNTEAQLVKHGVHLSEIALQLSHFSAYFQLVLDRLSLKERLRSVKKAIVGKARALRFRSSAAKLTEPAQTADSDLRNYAILCFPIIDWDFRFQRPQQLLTRFAQNGHPVYYATVTLDVSEAPYTTAKKSPNVTEVKFSAPKPVNIYKDSLGPDVVSHLTKSIGALLEQEKLTEVVLLVQFPSWYPLAKALSDKYGWKIVYDCMDEHSGFDNVGKQFETEERLLLSESDLAVVSSQKLLRKAEQRSQNVTLIPNAAEFEHFSDPQPNNSIKAQGPMIGYFGALAEWFDYEAIVKAAQKHTEWNFFIIGGHFSPEVKKLERLPNIQTPGEIPYHALPGYLAHFDVCLIPMRITPLIEATNPVKFFEYLCTGKPIVASELPELQPYSELYYSYATDDEFVEQVERALKENNPDLKRRRIDTARANQWKERYGKLADNIKALYPLVSILIPSYNNPNYVKICLESIRKKSLYPNLEVIVVDNASNRETQAALQEQEAKWDRLSVIFNKKNAGFARAINQAAEKAQGQYLALLNDDIVVTDGWVSALLKYFRDPSVGMVGPVTNSCGNEARIEVPYIDLDQMESFAYDNMRKNRNRFFEINVLAFFCTMIPRSVWREVGPLDERFEIGMFEDDDYALRVKKAGLKLICVKDVFVHHFGRTSFIRLGDEEYMKIFNRNKKLFEEKWNQGWVPHQRVNEHK